MPETQNPMQEVRVEKVVVNIGVGEAGERLIQSENLLEELTGRKPVRTRASRNAAGFGIRRGQEVGVKVTLRGDAAEEFLDEALFTTGHRLPGWAFDDNGNVSFGIDDHTDFEKMNYDPDVGIFGMDVTVVLQRPGTRVEKRRLRSTRVGEEQRVHWEDAMDLMEDEFDVEVI